MAWVTFSLQLTGWSAQSAWTIASLQQRKRCPHQSCELQQI
jgi:hypothetical protein